MTKQKYRGCKINLIQALLILVLLLVLGALASYLTINWTRNHVQGFASEMGQAAIALEKLNKTPATSLLKADQHLSAARRELDTLRPVALPAVSIAELLADFPWIGPPATQAVNLWLFANALTQLGETLLDGVELALTGLEEEGTAGLITAMPALQSHLQTAEANFAQLQLARTRLDPSANWWLPDEQAMKLADALARWDELAPDFGELLTETSRLASVVSLMLGKEEPVTYLLLLQSSDELRATGGFINTIGTIQIEDGKITELTLTEVSEAEELIEADWRDGNRNVRITSAPDSRPPPPMTLYMGLGYWVLRDANWWADFPTTARQAVALWNEEQRVPVDGVVAINDRLVRDLIEVVGPVPMADGTVVDDKNVKNVSLEQVYGSGNQASFFKEFGFTLIEMAKDLPPDRLFELGKLFGGVVSRRDLMIASFDPDLATTLHELGVDGALQGKRDDYLYLVEHNVSYNKLSPFIQQNLTYQVELEPTGRAKMATLTVDETNTYSVGAGLPGYPEGYYDGGYWDPIEFRVIRQEGYYGGYSRLYLPTGSRVLNVLGFDDAPRIGVESNRVVVGGYVGLLPNAPRQLQFSWVPGSRPSAPGQYRLLVQRQPGSPDHALSVEVHLPPGYHALEVRPPPIFMTDNTVSWHTVLDQDQAFSLQLEVTDELLAEMAMAAQGTMTPTQSITGPEYGRAQLPLWINIPAIAVDAPIVPVGLEPSGIMASPTQADLVGWYELGPRPGEPSNAILAGHVDLNGEIGVFDRLDELKPGDTIEVRSGPDISYRYQVADVNSYQVDNAPVAEIFGETPEPILTLITCGGTYDPNRQEYNERVVVRAHKEQD